MTSYIGPSRKRSVNMKKDSWSAFVCLFAAIAIAVSGGSPASAYRDGSVVNMDADEFSFAPSSPRVKPGKITFVVRNVGRYPHALAIENLRAGTPLIKPGETARLTVNISRGKTVFYCPLRGHREKGMEGSLAGG
jgi:plastocyanin